MILPREIVEHYPYDFKYSLQFSIVRVNEGNSFFTVYIHGDPVKLFINSVDVLQAGEMIPINDQIKSTFIQLIEAMAINGNKMVGYAKIVLPA